MWKQGFSYLSWAPAPAQGQCPQTWHTLAVLRLSCWQSLVPEPWLLHLSSLYLGYRCSRSDLWCHPLSSAFFLSSQLRNKNKIFVITVHLHTFTPLAHIETHAYEAYSYVDPHAHIRINSNKRKVKVKSCDLISLRNRSVRVPISHGASCLWRQCTSPLTDCLTFPNPLRSQIPIPQLDQMG